MKNWAVYNVTSGGKKGTFSSSPLKKKGRRKPDHRPVCVFCLGVGGGGVLPYMGYIGMCRCEVYGFQAVYSGIGYISQRVWV